MLIKLIILLLQIIILYYHPLYSFIFWFLFTAEYFWFLNYLLQLWKYRNEYFKIELEEIDLSDLNIFETWIMYCKLEAFTRIYTLASRKKINLRKILMCFLIIILGIPIKVLKLSYYFIFINEKNIKNGLKILYHQLFFKIREHKIEIFNKNIYINCYTIGKLITKAIKLPNQKIFNFLHDLKLASIDFNKYETKNPKIVELELSKIITQENTCLPNYHYTYKENNNTIHATSNRIFKIEDSQKIDIPIPKLIKPGAKNPGTIITKDAKEIIGTKKLIWIPEHQIASIQFNHLDIFNISNPNYEYIQNKKRVFKNILIIYLNNEWTEEFLSELTTDCYSHNLINTDNKTIIEEIKHYKDDII